MVAAFLVIVLGCTSIGHFLLGWPGGVLGFIIGIILWRKYRKMNRDKVDYDRISRILDEKLGK